VIYIFTLLLFFLPLEAKNSILTQPKQVPLIEPALQDYLVRTREQTVPVWIYFTDKNVFDDASYRQELESSRDLVSPRAIARRARMGGPVGLTFDDLPVQERYISILEKNGLNVRHRSRWLNAVSGYVPAGSLQSISDLPFVQRISLLHTSRHTREIEGPAAFGRSAVEGALDYGPSGAQLAQIKVPEVHAMGYSARGVLIAMLDTGFNLTHESLQNVVQVAEYDFVFHDNVTANQPEDVKSQEYHGTQTLSTIAGAKNGFLYGPAYGASFLLAKTEDVRSETPVEEDNWVAAMEWAEAQGVDVVNSSLGYLDWYTYQDMNGRTAVTTRAAARAAALGVVVCVSAGNERDSGWYYIDAPADADSIITVGAVDITGFISSFSSAGPTFDGRIKPEVVACGSAVYTASASCTTCYSSSFGTSFSSPLVAGVAALLLEAHPAWSPMQVREALMMTADRRDHPDNLYGYGLVDALKAIQYQQKGDVTGDDKVDETDVLAAAHIALKDASYSSAAIAAADLNRDGQVNIVDVVLMVNMLHP
jgi:serine protease AprX